MFDFDSLAVGGVALIPLVIGLVEVFKKAGVSGNALTYVAMGLGAILALLYKLSIMFPVTQPWIELFVFVVAGGVFALAATGLYDLGKSWIKPS